MQTEENKSLFLITCYIDHEIVCVFNFYEKKWQLKSQSSESNGKCWTEKYKK